MKRILILVFILFNCILMQAQEINKPNFAIASHPMMINNISFTSDQMVIDLTIENKVIGGNFCINKNTYTEEVLGKKKFMMTNSKNIPICPEVHQFSRIGKKLNFQLYFPKPDIDIQYLNLIEDCDENCFSMLGIIFDQKMNEEIDEAFKTFDNGNYESCKTILVNIIKAHPEYPFGFLYLNLVQVLVIQEEIEKAQEYYQIVANSNFQDKQFILEQLNKLDLLNK